MKKVLDWVDENLEATICMILISIFTVVLFIQVVMRYVFNNSLSWSEELARYLFIWMVFIGVSYGAKQMKHLKIDVFLNVFPKKVKPYIVILADVIVLAISVIIVYSGWTVVQGYVRLGVTSPAIKAPYWFVYSAAVVGYGLTCIRQVQTIVYRIYVLRTGIDPLAKQNAEAEEEVPQG